MADSEKWVSGDKSTLIGRIIKEGCDWLTLNKSAHDRYRLLNHGVGNIQVGNESDGLRSKSGGLYPVFQEIIKVIFRRNGWYQVKNNDVRLYWPYVGYIGKFCQCHRQLSGVGMVIAQAFDVVV